LGTISGKKKGGCKKRGGDHKNPLAYEKLLGWKAKYWVGKKKFTRPPPTKKKKKKQSRGKAAALKKRVFWFGQKKEQENPSKSLGAPATAPNRRKKRGPRVGRIPAKIDGGGKSQEPWSAKS